MSAEQDSWSGQDSKETVPVETKQDGISMGTFKTPSFVIPSKKKVQSSTNTAGMFKSPGSIVKTGVVSNTTENTEKEKNASEISDISIESHENIELKTDKIHTDKSDSDSKPNVEIETKAGHSAAEEFQQSQASIPYREPSWSGVCDETFALEVIKNGAVIDNINLTTKAFHVIGRLPSCDISMEHPSLSRHHAVVQYSSGNSEKFQKGWYLIDLDSTHGTWINKNKVPSQKFHRIHVDYVLKFGGSTRLFIVQGPDADRQEESELSASEMKQQREKQKKEVELLRQAEIDEAEKKAEILKKMEESKGCSWGIDEDDAQEEDENAENPFASIDPENEALYVNDPKRSLNGYFEREGLELPEYEFNETGYGKWKCSVELPIDAPSGEPIMAEVVVTGKKRDAVVACALEACRILDRHGELRKSTHESRKRKRRNWEDDDFYDSDEDVYLDRTGAIEKKRELRKNKVGKTNKTTETYDTLSDKHKTVIAEIEEIESKIEHAKAQAAAMESDDIDALDAYMSAIKSGMMDTKTKMKLKRQVLELKQKEQRIRKLVNIARPTSMPELVSKSLKTDVKKTGVMATVGKMKGPLPGKLSRKVFPNSKREKTEEISHEIEEDEDGDNERLSETRETDGKKDDIPDDSKIIAAKTNDLKAQAKENVQKSEVHLRQTELKSKVKGPSLPAVDIKEVDVDKHGSQSHSKSRTKASSLPLAAVLEKLQEEADNAEEGNDAEKRWKDGSKRKSKGENAWNKKLKTDDGAYNVDDPDYAVWLPPENQSGDGKTHLNAKLGY